ncbi:MAG: T9SS type A sorting domain-containing protein [Saprospirales bacterium]|nr:T9SS type A sorting domain-containing protein [Saprospirales bacterium]MBK8922129.1 T9SS type A sorting domain-containing protein [Saprospirales bacterium]
MKKALLLFATLCFTTFSFAQVTCVRDSSILQAMPFQLLSPAPWTPDSPAYNLKTACIGEPYNQSVTVNVPATYTVGTFTVPLTSVSIATTNAIGNYPAGMTYTCDPPNCVFPATTLGCIHLHGTPSIANIPDTFNLKITATIQIPGFPPQMLNFPEDVSDSSHYYLILKAMGQCISGANDLDSPFSILRALPNPVSQQTAIEVHSTLSGRFQFEVFNLLGARVHSENVLLFEGANQFTFDASNLPNGAYFYTLGNAGGKSVRRLIKL